MTKGKVLLTWKTATEANNSGFYIERRNEKEDNYKSIGFIQGHGKSNIPHTYSLTDNPKAGRYFYRLRQIDADGTCTLYDKYMYAIIYNYLITNRID
jgi:hypothetical protein